MPMASDAQLEKSSFVLFGQQSGVARRTYDAGHGAGCEHGAAAAGAGQSNAFKLVHVFDVDDACAQRPDACRLIRQKCK